VRGILLLRGREWRGREGKRRGKDRDGSGKR